MKLINKSNNQILANDLREAKFFLDKLLGLMNKSNPRSMLFKTRFGIHSFFLKDGIDVLVLDSNYKVVKAKENLRPNKLFIWNPRFFWVIELPRDTLKKTNTKLGDKLKLSR